MEGEAPKTVIGVIRDFHTESLKYEIPPRILRLMRLVSGDFLMLILISVLVASPIVWYLMNDWLQDFSYRIHISWMDMAVTILAAMVITSLTVGIRVGKAALQNPVDAVRDS